jgi:hypothetical protein
VISKFRLQFKRKRTEILSPKCNKRHFSASPKSCLYRRPRLIYLAEQRESSRKCEVRDGEISVCLKGSAQPSDCFGIGFELHLGDANPYEPPMGKSVARRKAECLVEVGFYFRASTKKILGVPMTPCAVARLRSSTDARSHSAMPWTMRLVSIWTRPRNKYA